MIICNICEGETKDLHSPKNSKIGLKIIICFKCGFVQSTKNTDSDQRNNNKTRNIDYLSCDADYSEVRVGKQQMVKSAEILIERNIQDFPRSLSVLDMSSARGHFLKYIQKHSPRKIVAFENDIYMTEGYKDSSKYEVMNIEYRQYTEEEKFDLIYSCHTLEHYSKPLDYFKFINKHLNNEGLFVLDVPNLDGINNGLIIDDYFYDKHRSYYEIRILDYLTQINKMRIVDKIETSSSVLLLIKKTEDVSNPEMPKENYKTNTENIQTYLSALNSNRKKAPEVVKKINKEIKGKHSKPIIFFGAGRLFDGLIKYGGLEINNIDYLVDSYLYDATDKIHNLQLDKIDLLEREKDGTVFVSAKTSSNEITKLLKEKYKVNNVVLISEYF